MIRRASAAGRGVQAGAGIPPDARHALRNVSSAPATALIITSPGLVQFLERTGRPVRSRDQILEPAGPEVLDVLVTKAASRGDWRALPEENAAVGLDLR